MSASRPSFRLLSLNVNGLASSASKRRALFSGLADYDIICLQETHHSGDRQAQRWLLEGAGPAAAWRGPAFWSHGSSASCGVAILFTSKLPWTDVSQRSAADPAGRCISVDCCLYGSQYTVASVYAPCEHGHRPAFFMALADALRLPPQRCSLVAGDFNCILDQNLDQTAAALLAPAAGRVSRRACGSEALQAFLLCQELADPWRLRHPAARDFTYVSTDRGSAARLDRIYVSSAMMPQSSCESFVDGLPGDHRAVSARITAPTAVLQGKGCWCLPSQLLADELFLSACRAELQRCSRSCPLSAAGQAQQFLAAALTPLPPSHPADPVVPTRPQEHSHAPGLASGRAVPAVGVNIHPPVASPAPSSAATQQLASCVRPLSARALWDAMVDSIFKVAVRRQRQRRLADGRQRHALRRKVARAAAAACVAHPMPTALAAYVEAQAYLRESLAAESRIAAARAGVVERDFGETSTYFFHRTYGRPPPLDRHIHALSLPAAEPQAPPELVALSTHAARRRAGDAIASFYSSDSPDGLFRPGDTDAAASRLMLGSLDRRLASCDARACEGPLSVAELRVALTTLPRGKSPGTDGLPYELYLALWDELGQPLCDAFNEALQASSQSDSPSLTDRQRSGCIVLIPKPGQPDRSQLGSYRPITLFNADVRIASKALALRFAAPLATVIDATQTAFVPGRWIGDNILLHLEEVDYLGAVQQPGAIALLDFAKAFDRLDRQWLDSSMAALGFGPDARSWVRLLLAGSQASVSFNGWLSPRFPTAGGVGQGNPLSPLLYVLAAQPLASRARQLQRQDAFVSLMQPDGAPAPPTHQHADDTSLHARSPADVAVLYRQAVLPFCAASGARLNVGKTHGLLLGSLAAAPPFVDPDSGFTYGAGPARHLGISIGGDFISAVAEQQSRKLASISLAVARWSRHRLSFLGRAYVARQCFASQLSHIFTFAAPDPAVFPAIRDTVLSYVSTGFLLPADKRAAAAVCVPSRLVSSLPVPQGGAGLPDLQHGPASLLCKYVSRLLQPASPPWTAFAAAWLRRLAPDGAGVPGHSLPSAALDVLMSEAPLPALPPRVRAAFAAFRSLRPHRELQRPAVAWPPSVAGQATPPSLAVQSACGWCVGSVAASQLTPRLAAQRLRVLQLVAHGRPGYLPDRPLRPRVWEGDPSAGAPDQGVHHVEEVWAQQRQQLEQRDLAQRRRRGVASMAASRAAWMQPPPARPSPADRRAVARLRREEARAAPVASARQRQPAALQCVAIDAAQRHPVSPPWAAAWAPLAERRVSRQQRETAWRILHAVLPCAAYKARFRLAVSPACPRPLCGGRASNLTHVFGTCSLSAPVICWLADVWAAVYPGNRPPASFAVVAAGDTRLWRPANPVLWLRLRLLLLDVLWQAARCPDRASGSSPAALMASIISQAAADMRLDWLRATMPATALAAVCGAWLTGAARPATASPLEEFAACWCHGGRLCGQPQTATIGLDIRWSAVWPVPFPGRPPDVAV